jgi:hypothetical protein
MMKQQRVLKNAVILILILFTFHATANSDDDDSRRNKISGTVLDGATNSPLEFANVAVYSIPDSSLVPDLLPTRTVFLKLQA